MTERHELAPVPVSLWRGATLGEIVLDGNRVGTEVVGTSLLHHFVCDQHSLARGQMFASLDPESERLLSESKEVRRRLAVIGLRVLGRVSAACKGRTGHREEGK